MNAQLSRDLVDLICDAAHAGCSDLHLEVFPEGAYWRGRILGSLIRRERLTAAQATRAIAALKTAAGMDTTERRLPQDGRLRVTGSTLDVDCRINTLATLHGEKLVLRLQVRGERALPLTALGLTPTQLERIRHDLMRTEGLILVTGPTGSGKTRTLYAMLQTLDTEKLNISTVEDPVEIELAGINQVPIRTAVGMDFAVALRAMLRQDPDVLMIGEIRDAETAHIACQAAQTGHLVLATLHASHPLSAVVRLQQLGVERYQLAACLNMLINQRLQVVQGRRSGVFTLCEGHGAFAAALVAEPRHLDAWRDIPSGDAVAENGHQQLTLELGR